MLSAAIGPSEPFLTDAAGRIDDDNADFADI